MRRFKDIVYRKIKKTGEELYFMGLVSSHSGNLSIRCANKIFITARGSMLGRLTRKEIIEVPLKGKGLYEKASRELPTHRNIYLRTENLAVVHAHPPHAIALSLHTRIIKPIDYESSLYLPEVHVIKNEKIQEVVPEYLMNGGIVVVKGHGSFAAAKSIEDALHFTTALEISSKIIVIEKIIGG